MLRPLPTTRAASKRCTYTVTSRTALATLRVLRAHSADHRQSLALITPRRLEKLSRYRFSTSTKRMDLTERAEQMLARLKAGLDSRPGPRSERTPDLMPYQNKADRIEKLLAEDRFRTWGLVVYRCTYRSDDDWNEFLRRFNLTVRHTLEEYNGLDIFDSYAPTVLEDKDFDGATTSAIRGHFNEWVVTASEREQGIPWKEAQNAKLPRYNFCIMVDEEALQSVLSIPAPDDLAPGRAKLNKTAYVILVNRKWPQYLADFEDEELAEIPDEDDNQEPIEGCTLQDVGWMKVLYDYAQIDATLYMHSTNNWRVQYYRPPEVGFQY